MTKDCIIVDLDGTIADCEHRRHFIERKPKNWDAFLDPVNIFNDPLIETIANVVRIFSQHYAIVYCSGRSASTYAITVDWLKKHELWNSPVALYMRNKGDKRPDFEIKAELLHKMRMDGWNPVLVLDDRDSVVKMWREQGLTCLQVAEGDF